MFFLVSEFFSLHEIEKHFHIRSSYDILKATYVAFYKKHEEPGFLEISSRKNCLDSAKIFTKDGRCDM